jgi:hypothetical protein
VKLRVMPRITAGVIQRRMVAVEIKFFMRLVWFPCSL